jgi:hypothetical protein
VVWWLAPILWSSEAWVRVFALHYFLRGVVNARAGLGAGCAGAGGPQDSS